MTPQPWRLLQSKHPPSLGLASGGRCLALHSRSCGSFSKMSPGLQCGLPPPVLWTLAPVGGAIMFLLANPVSKDWWAVWSEFARTGFHGDASLGHIYFPIMSLWRTLSDRKRGLSQCDALRGDAEHVHVLGGGGGTEPANTGETDPFSCVCLANYPLRYGAGRVHTESQPACQRRH